VEYRHNLNNRKLSEITLGDFRNIHDLSGKLNDISKSVNDNRGEWSDKPGREEVDNALSEGIDQALDEAQERIDDAKQELERAVDNIERTKIDLQDAKIAIQNTIDNPQDYVGNFDGTIAADSIILRDEVIASNARFIGTIQGNALTVVNADIETANIIDANIVDAVITGTLNGVDGRFVGTVVAENIQGQEIAGVTFRTGRDNDKYIHMQEQEVTLWDGSLDKLHIGFRNEYGNPTEKPYMIWGHGQPDGTDKM